MKVAKLRLSASITPSLISISTLVQQGMIFYHDSLLKHMYSGKIALFQLTHGTDRCLFTPDDVEWGPQWLPWCYHGSISTYVWGAVKPMSLSVCMYGEQCEMMTQSSSLDCSTVHCEMDIIVNYLSEESSVWNENGFIMTQKMARLLSKPSVSCDVSIETRRSIVHMWTLRERLTYFYCYWNGFMFGAAKRQNLSSPAELCARCWSGLQQQATLMSQRSWTILFCCLLSLFLANCRGGFFVFAFFYQHYFYIITRVVM